MLSLSKLQYVALVSIADGRAHPANRSTWFALDEREYAELIDSPLVEQIEKQYGVHVRITDAGHAELARKRCCKCGVALAEILLAGQDERCEVCGDPS